MKAILLAGGLSLILTMIGTRYAIKVLARRGYGQLIREDGPTTHATKRGTPTMGGVLILGALVVSCALWADLAETGVLVALGTALALAVLAGGIPFVVNWLVTGSPISSGASAKSWWGNVPFHADSILRTVAWHYGEILERFVAGTWAGDHWFLAPGMLPLAAVGWWALARRREHAAVLLTAGGFFLGTAATSSLITATWHAGRYQVPFLGLLVPVAALGVAQLVFWLPGRFRTLGLAVAGLYLLAASAHALVLARASYANAVYVVAHQQIALGDWMRENLPPGTQVAVSDAGALRYVSERPILDLVGLTTQGAAVPWRHASGSLFGNGRSSLCLLITCSRSQARWASS